MLTRLQCSYCFSEEKQDWTNCSYFWRYGHAIHTYMYIHMMKADLINYDQNVEGIRSVSSQVLSEVRSAQLGQVAPVHHHVDLSSINRLLSQEVQYSISAE